MQRSLSINMNGSTFSTQTLPFYNGQASPYSTLFAQPVHRDPSGEHSPPSSPPRASNPVSMPLTSPWSLITKSWATVTYPGIICRHFHHPHTSWQHFPGSKKLANAHTDCHWFKLNNFCRHRTKRFCAGSAPNRQLSFRSGHNIQHPLCGSNSPGIRNPSSLG